MTSARILFVDDEVQLIEGLRRMLRRYRSDWETLFAASGAEALSLMQAEPVDVLVTDMQMPEMNGAELLQHVASRWPETVRVVLTGYADEEMDAVCVQEAHQRLNKPIAPRDLHDAISRACMMRGLILDQRSRRVIAGDNMPPNPPEIYLELKRAPDSPVVQAADIVAGDRALTAKLLRMAGSSFFGPGRTVSSPEEAVALLGLPRVRGVALINGLMRMFVPSRQQGSFSIERFWSHSLQVAELARLIHGAEPDAREQPEEAFAAGLLHDVGLLLIAASHEELFRQEMAAAGDKDICEFEADRLGVTHAEVGASLLALWGLPTSIVEAVLCHHDPERAGADRMCIALAVYLANAFSADLQQREGHRHWNPIARELEPAVLERAGLGHRLNAYRELALELTQAAVETAI